MIVDLRNLEEKLKSGRSAAVTAARGQAATDVGTSEDQARQHSVPVRKVLLGMAAVAVVAVAQRQTGSGPGPFGGQVHLLVGICGQSTQFARLKQVTCLLLPRGLGHGTLA